MNPKPFLLDFPVESNFYHITTVQRNVFLFFFYLKVYTSIIPVFGKTQSFCLRLCSALLRWSWPTAIMCDDKKIGRQLLSYNSAGFLCLSLCNSFRVYLHGKSFKLKTIIAVTNSAGLGMIVFNSIPFNDNDDS